jgi:phage terminase small subunit
LVANRTKLTDKQRAFINGYLANGFNATQAALEAGYSPKSARSIGSENLTKPDIREEIDRRLAALRMSADEVLYRLTQHATASLEDFLQVEDGTTPRPDLAKAAKAGKLGLLKKVKFSRLGGIEAIEIHDPQAALVHLGRHHRLFVDRTEHTGVVVTVTADDMAEAKRNVREWEKDRFGDDG